MRKGDEALHICLSRERKEKALLKSKQALLKSKQALSEMEKMRDANPTIDGRV